MKQPCGCCDSYQCPQHVVQLEEDAAWDWDRHSTVRIWGLKRIGGWH